MMDFLKLLGEAYVFIPTVAFSVLALILGRGWVFVLPVIWWIGYALLGLEDGENWQVFVALYIIYGLAAVALGLLLHRVVFRRGKASRDTRC